MPVVLAPRPSRVLRSRANRLAAACTLLAASIAPRAAHACCGVGYGVGQRLGPSESAAVVADVGATDRWARWDDAGHWAPLAGGSSDRELRADVSGLFRIASRWQLGVAAGGLATWRRYGELASHGGGVGDVVATGRYEILPLRGAGGPPAVAVTLGATVPTGRSAAGGTDALGSDVTGLGTWELRPGVAAEAISQHGWSTSIAASIGLRAPSSTPDGTLHRGPRGQLLVAGGKAWWSGASIAAGVLVDAEPAPRVGDRPSAGSGLLRTAGMVVGAVPIAAELGFVATATADLPISGLGRNEPIARALTLGVRWALPRG